MGGEKGRKKGDRGGGGQRRIRIYRVERKLNLKTEKSRSSVIKEKRAGSWTWIRRKGGPSRVGKETEKG